MCGYLDKIRMTINNPDILRQTWDIDSCIYNYVEALLKCPNRPVESCCGHGDGNGFIWFEDGTLFEIWHKRAGEKRYYEHFREMSENNDHKSRLMRGLEI